MTFKICLDNLYYSNFLCDVSTLLKACAIESTVSFEDGKLIPSPFEIRNYLKKAFKTASYCWFVATNQQYEAVLNAFFR